MVVYSALSQKDVSKEREYIVQIQAFNSKYLKKVVKEERKSEEIIWCSHSFSKGRDDFLKGDILMPKCSSVMKKNAYKKKKKRHQRANPDV